MIIEYGFGVDHELVLGLVIDDGDVRRGKRRALRKVDHRYVGLAVHGHDEFDYQLTILLAYDVRQLGNDDGCGCVLI
jgi:hypothetical protein